MRQNGIVCQSYQCYLRPTFDEIPFGQRLLIERVVQKVPGHWLAAQLAVTTDLVMLMMTGGYERTDAEYEELLTSTGFALEGIMPSQSGYSVVKCTAVSAR